MSILLSILDSPYGWYYSMGIGALMGGVYNALILTPSFFTKHPRNDPLPPKIQSLLLWEARLHSLLYVWYLAVLLHMAPAMLTPADERLYLIHVMSKLYEQVDVQYVLLTASTGPGPTLDLKFLDRQLNFQWLACMGTPEAIRRNALPGIWMVFAGLDKAHYVLMYSYLGRVWGQRDGGLLGKRVLQVSMVVHLVSGIAVDIGALAGRRVFDVTYGRGDNWGHGATLTLLAVDLSVSVSQMLLNEASVAAMHDVGEGGARLKEKVGPAMERVGVVAPRNTTLSSREENLDENDDQGKDGGRPSADKPGPGS